MKNIFILLSLSMFLSLFSCSTLIKDKMEIEKVAEDAAVEIVEDAAVIAK